MMNSRTVSSLAVGLLLIVAGCDAPKKTASKGPPVQSRETINKTTQNVLKLDEELKNGAKLAATNITSTDYLGTMSEAYKTSVAKIAGMQVSQMMQIYEIQNDKPVQNYDEFMSAIIKKGQPDGIQLPMLPYYQEYAFDEANKKLVVVEYPEKKAKMQEQQDEKLGR